jgi:hypothetical protein
MASREYMETLYKLAVTEITERALMIWEQWAGKDGLVYGDVPLSKEDFVMFYIDLNDRGVLDNLRVVSPEIAKDFDERFERTALEVMVR